jgi:hypothetical protein
VPDRLVNAHLLGDAEPGFALVADTLTAAGFGWIALPPSDLSPAALAITIELAVDQVHDYATNGYRVVWIRTSVAPGDRLVAQQVEAECKRRGFAELTILDLVPESAERFVEIAVALRAFASTGREGAENVV